MTRDPEETGDNDEAIARLGLLMARAIAARDFEAAARLRDEIDRLAGVDPAKAHASSIGRPSPGAMGAVPPTVRPRPGWKPPPKPDLMTSTIKPARGKPKGG